jgi:hypothetical protein
MAHSASEKCEKAPEECGATTLNNLPNVCVSLITEYIGDFLQLYACVYILCKDIPSRWLAMIEVVRIDNIRSEQAAKRLFQRIKETNVKFLTLDKVNISARDLSELLDLESSPHLLHLQLRNIKNEINLWDCGLTENLALRSFEVDMAPVTYIGSLCMYAPQLVSLSLTNILDFGDSGLSALESTIQRLEHLKLVNVHLSDLGVVYLLRILSEYCFEKECAKHNGPNRFCKLKRLELSSKKITSHAFDLIREAEYLQLTHLNVGGCRIQNADPVRRFMVKKGHGLKCLGLGSPTVDDTILASSLFLDGYPRSLVSSLQELHLTGAGISDRSVDMIVRVFGAPNDHLRVLNISWCTLVTGRSIENLGKVVSLEELYLNKCRRIKLDHLIPVLVGCNRLQKLSCRDIPVKLVSFNFSR